MRVCQHSIDVLVICLYPQTRHSRCVTVMSVIVSERNLRDRDCEFAVRITNSLSSFRQARSVRASCVTRLED